MDQAQQSITQKVLAMIYSQHKYSNVRLRTEKICPHCGCELAFMLKADLISCQSCFSIHKEERFAS